MFSDLFIPDDFWFVLLQGFNVPTNSKERYGINVSKKQLRNYMAGISEKAVLPCSDVERSTKSIFLLTINFLSHFTTFHICICRLFFLK